MKHEKSYQRRVQNRVRLTLESLEKRDCPSAYSIIDLLPPSGTSSSSALALNDSGQIVGRTSVSGYSRAAVWQAGAGPTAGGALLPILSSGGSDAYDVNNRGMIAGFSASHAVAWTKSGTSYIAHDLGTLPGFTGSQALALSEPDAGGVTWFVGASDSASMPRHATVWCVDAAGSIVSTISLEPTMDSSRANDVRMIDPSPSIPGDEYILVTGEVQLPGLQYAAVWKLDLAGGVLSRTDLGTLGGTFSRGFAINALGHVVGDSSLADGSTRAFIYNAGAMTNLGTLTNGHSLAEGLNDSDVAVGKSYIDGSLSSKAFVWSAGGMLDLREQLGTKDKSNWSVLFAAYDINSQGQIVGNGSVGKGRSAQGHGFVMTPSALHARTIGRQIATPVPSRAQLQIALPEASSRWQATGAAVDRLLSIDIRIADLGGTTLGLASGSTIWLDDNAAGRGWYIDAKPWDDAEFTTPRDQGEQQHMDLLTVLAHEIGHLLGQDHENTGVMEDTLAAGTRRMPGAGIQTLFEPLLKR